MANENPLPDSGAAKIWTKGPCRYVPASDRHRMADFIREAAGSALSIRSDMNLVEAPKEPLFALAVQATRMELGLDVIGSILVLAVVRGSTVALPAMAQSLEAYLEARSAEANRVGGGFDERLELKQALRDVRTRMSTISIIDEFDKLQKELIAAGNALTLGEAWGQFHRTGNNGTTHRVVAPKLKNLRHIEGGEEEFRILTAPMPLWKSPVPVETLAAVLSLEFPHLAKVTGEIAAFVAGGSAASLRPILLVGPAAIGKDSILRRAAELVGRPHREYDLAGSSDSRILRGTAKGWSTASPSFAVTVCAQHHCPNPLIQYSELDRAGGGRHNGVVHETLLALCEPSTRKKWFDDGLGSEVDLGDVALVFTANGIDDTPQPLLTRLRILHLDRPAPEHVAEILEQARRRYAAELNVRIDDLPEIRPEAVEKLKVVARAGRFQLRLADRVVRALGDRQYGRPAH
jgi:hypothetical protein